MKLINLKWGYDGGGMACGPVAGSTIAKLNAKMKMEILILSISPAAVLILQNML